MVLYCPTCKSDEKAFRSALRRTLYAEAIQSYNQRWREENHERVLAYAREYAQHNKAGRQAWMDANRSTVRQWTQRRRARLKLNGIYVVSERDLIRLLERHSHRCAYCGVSLTTMTVTWDHIMPISRGGCHSVGNLTPACKACNSSKRHWTLVEWRARRASAK